MLSATLTSLWARKVRLLLSALSIVLGVAFVSGSLMFTNLLSSSFDQIIKGGLGDVNVSPEDTGIAGFEQGNAGGPLLTDADVAEVEALDGVERATGIVSSPQIYPLDKDGRLLAFTGAPGLGMNWHDTPAAGGLTGARLIEGRTPEADDEVVADPATVSRGGYAIGDVMEVSTPKSGVKSYELVGTGTYGTGSTAGASYLFFTVREAQAIAQDGAEGYYGMWIQTSPEADPDDVATAVQGVVPDGFAAETGEELAVDLEAQLDVGLGFVNTFLLVFAAIALLVAALLILNTFSILVAQRSRELALLRAIGAKRSQVRNSVLLEALIVGLLGATLGLLAGYGLAWGILALLRGFGMELGDAVPSLSWPAVGASYAIGLLVTMVAAYIPARRASRTRPVEALAAAAHTGPEKASNAPIILGIALVELGVAAIVCAVWVDVARPLVWAGVGAAMLLIGMVLAAVVVGGPLIWLFGKAYRAMFGEVGKMAQLNAVRQPRRTAATAATLMIGLALVSAVAILAASTTTSVRERLTEDQRGDFTISPVAYQPFDAKSADRAREVDGVEAVYEFRRGMLMMGEVPEQVMGASPEGLQRGTSLSYTGTLTADGPVAPAIVSHEFADAYDLTLGQLFEVPTIAGEPISLLVTGLHNWGTAFTVASVIVDEETYAQLADPTMVNNLVIFAEEGADPEAVRAGLLDATAELPTVVVSDTAEFAQTRVDQFGQIFSTLYALLALAIVISVLGIVNTLGLSVMERTREVGLLRAVGMTRPQLRRMVTLESVLVATLGATLGVLLGVVFGSMLVTLLRSEGIQTLVIPWLQLAVFVVVAAAFGVLAAVGPARRAARLNVLDSIATE